MKSIKCFDPLFLLLKFLNSILACLVYIVNWFFRSLYSSSFTCESSKGLIASFTNSKASLMINRATIIAKIGSKKCQPVNQITIMPIPTPMEEYTSVFKCNASAFSAMESVSFATLYSLLLTKKLIIAEINITAAAIWKYCISLG